ncbi:hypothetical protein [Novosphingobium sp. Gsoil 351]|uniref:hypothetical protein n=1 Tax=Novosphingobium sp. Gsoil 351 TaxID=2675225 RepID=UPI001E34BD9B|nr:hypothetical protein [Novosphingobium sp. Gsoil 351]
MLEPGAGAIDAQREEMRQAGDAGSAQTAQIAALSQMLALAAGVSPDDVMIDRDHRRASVAAAPLPGASVATYRALEQRSHQEADDWDIAINPPQGPLPLIAFADNADTLDPAARDAVLTSAWAARRWNVRALAVPGLPETTAKSPNLTQRRALAIAAILKSSGIGAVPTAPAGQSFRLSAAAREGAP